ncbi:MAG TPA: hypothetical protein D7H92_00155, partial [Candidatus Poseidoniales archaeon]
MGFARTAVGVLFLSVLLFYLATVGQLTDEAKWGFVGAMGVLAFAYINLGGKAQPASRPRPRSPRPQAVEVKVEDELPEVEEDDDDLPEPVTADSLDGATLRERKLAKIAAAQAAAEAAQAENLSEDENDAEMMVEVEVEDVHVADEYVVDVSPESVEDAD